MSALIKYTKSGQESKLDIIGVSEVSEASDCDVIFDVKKPRGKKVGKLFYKANGDIVLQFGTAQDTLYSVDLEEGVFYANY